MKFTREMEKEMDEAVFPGGNLSLQHVHHLYQRISGFQKRHRFFLHGYAGNYPAFPRYYMQ